MNGESWILPRFGDAPPHLLDAMVEAVRGQSEATVPATRAAGALALYQAVLSGTGGREDAFPLLVADALLTHAFQAQAELAPEELDAFAEGWGGSGRLAELAR